MYPHLVTLVELLTFFLASVNMLIMISVCLSAGVCVCVCVCMPESLVKIAQLTPVLSSPHTNTSQTAKNGLARYQFSIEKLSLGHKKLLPMNVSCAHAKISFSF